MSEHDHQTTATKPSELKRLLEAAIDQGFISFMITDSLGDIPEAIIGVDRNNDFVPPTGGGDYKAAFAELGLPLPIDPGNAAGWVVLDGHRLEYQGLRVLPQHDNSDDAWEVTFHVAGPCEFPADRYRPDVYL